MKSITTALLAGTIIATSSCATLMREDEGEKITFNPEPKGALVYVNGDYLGLSPQSMTLDPSETYKVKYVHPHYLSHSFTLEKGLIKKWLWLDLLSLAAGNPAAIITDAITDKWKGFDDKSAKARLLHWSEIDNPSNYLNQIFQLKNLYFETGSGQIKQESKGNLDKLAEFLKKYPTAKIAIHGHTDKTGGRDLNMKLSQERSKSVKEYLTSKGVDASRMTSDGHGPDKPLLEGDTPEVHTYNRRVEFEFVK